MAARTISRAECPHVGEIKVQAAEAEKCSVCDVRQHLRLCTSCGGVFCCESHNAHNREHFEATKRPIIQSTPTTLPYQFTWCWICNAYLG